MPPRILLSAGEPSGDLHGEALAAALRARWPNVELYGLGGAGMERQGVRLLAHTDDLAVMGVAEVVGRLPFLLRLLRRMKRELGDSPPDLLIPIDYPGFNLRLSRSARQRGVPVLYFIAPQVWAWHRSRMASLARDTDRIAVILPFEEALFRAAGAHATFVGHPLLDGVPAAVPRARFCADAGLDPDAPILAVFPGSRRQEVSRHLTAFMEAARLVVEARPDVQPVVAAAPGIPGGTYTGIPTTADSWQLLLHARAALVKSGTTTLQAAITDTPMVVAYRMHPFTFALARRLVRVPHVALANLVAGERIAPELMQEEATPEALAAALLARLDEGDERRGALEGLARIRAALRPADSASSATTAERVVAVAAELIETR